MTLKSGRGRIRAVNPARLDETIGVYPWSLDEAGAAVKQASAAFRKWSNLSLERRTAALKKFKKVIARRQDELATVITRETGKACWESKEEVALVLSKFDYTFKAGEELFKPQEPSPNAFGVYQPYGVSLVLGPFNFPAHLAHGHIIPALLAGNTVLFKPSDKACGVGRFYGNCAREAGLSPGIINVVQGPAAIGEFLVSHPSVKTVLFTGSCAVGERIRKLTFHQPDKLLALEMGGKNAAVVFRDADLSLAAAECARGAFITAGQRCTSTSRIFVDARVMDQFCAKFVSIARQFRVGDPFDPENFCGPVISENSCARAESAIREARRLGGDPILRGGRFDAKRGHFLRLSAHRFERYPGRCRYTAVELFAPEVGIYPFKHLEEAAGQVEDTDYGLAVSVFTGNKANFQKILSETAHGIVNWNVGTIGASGQLPFGGRKKSGNARPAGSFAIRNCVYPVASRFLK